MSGTVGDNTARASGVIASAGGGGKILQIVQSVKTGTSSISGGWADISDLSIAITPTAENSKIMLSASVMCHKYGAMGFLKLLRDIGGAGYADSAYIGDAAGSRIQCSHMLAGDWTILDANFDFLDSPSYSLTDEITYKVQGKCSNGSYPTYVNRAYYDTNSTDYGRFVSSITAREVSA